MSEKTPALNNEDVLNSEPVVSPVSKTAFNILSLVKAAPF